MKYFKIVILQKFGFKSHDLIKNNIVDQIDTFSNQFKSLITALTVKSHLIHITSFVI